MKLLTWLLIVATLVALIWYAPKYLTYSDQPIKSDVIVLFLGPDFDARKKEALKLIEEGYAQHLLIPAYGQIFDIHSLSRIHASTRPLVNASPHSRLSAFTHYPRFYEGTHIEMLKAKKMVDQAGFKSAIFVSSPIHMRRVKIIATKVFDSPNLSVRFVFTRYENETNGLWLFNKSAIGNVTSEYLKTAWFLTYRIFS